MTVLPFPGPTAALPALNERQDNDKLLAFLPNKLRALIEPDIDRIEEIKIRLEREVWVLIDGHYVAYPYRIELSDMAFLIAKLGTFRDDNRRGVEGTGHRITRVMGADGTSEGSPVGFTFRVGRYFPGIAEPLRPFIVENPSLLLVGEAGMGKTTALRGIAEMIAQYYPMQTVVVDTSGDVAGDGKVPHKGIGNVDVMPVRSKAMQAQLIEEAIKNQNVRVLVVDEINRLAEAEMIAGGRRSGARLVGTTHGKDLPFVLNNQNLAPLFNPAPVFHWFALMVRRGEIMMYRAEEAISRIRAGQEPKGQLIRLGGR